MTRPVLISINTSWNIYNFRAPLIHALKAQGYSVISAAPADAYTERLRALVDGHTNLPMDNAGTSPLKDLLLFCRYLRLLQREKPAVMLAYTIKPNIYGTLAARVLGIPVINNVSGLGTAFIRDNWLTRVAKQLYRIAFRSSAMVFFQNAEDRDLFVQLKLVAAEKTDLLAGSGIALDYFHPRFVPARDPAAPLSFVLIARLLWDKGIGEYVDAARIIKATHPEIRFRIVGQRGVQNKTSIPDSVIAQWASEHTVDYLGETDDIRSVIAAHDCVVLPSYREGLSRVLLEAAAMGKPLIATDVAGCRQVVESMKNGLLCNAQDAADLAATMTRFIALSPAEREEMGRASRAKAECEFDEKRVFKKYADTIASLV